MTDSSGTGNLREPSAVFLGSESWEQLKDARDPNSFAAAWLDIQCQIINADIHQGVVVLGSEAFGQMDLVTVLSHEAGHLLGLEHNDGSSLPLMNESLDEGTRLVLTVNNYVNAQPETPVYSFSLIARYLLNDSHLLINERGLSHGRFMHDENSIFDFTANN